MQFSTFSLLAPGLAAEIASAACTRQAGREVRVMVKPEIVNDERMIPLARDICKKIEEELEYPGQIKVNIIRESRASDFENKIS